MISRNIARTRTGLPEIRARGVRIKINGKPLDRREDFRIGRRTRLDQSDLVLFIEAGATEPVTVELTPVSRRR